MCSSLSLDRFLIVGHGAQRILGNVGAFVAVAFISDREHAKSDYVTYRIHVDRDVGPWAEAPGGR